MASRTSILVSKTIYQMAVAVCFGVAVWVGFSVYQALSVTPKLDVDPQLLETLSVELDQEALNRLAEREQLSANIDSLFASYEASLDIVETGEINELTVEEVASGSSEME